MFPRPTHSNCPLATIWLCLAGRAEWVIATKSDISGWRWHFGTVSRRNPDMVYHFKRTRLVKRQPFAPFWFEGRMLSTSRAALERSKSFLWCRPAWQVVPLLVCLTAAVLVPWMLASALYWPLWLAHGVRQARRRARA